MIDVDHFKAVNDRFGHDAGDRVLRELAERFRTRIRGEDAFGRWGGEEFLALLPSTEAEGADAVRGSVCGGARADHRRRGVVTVTVSIGIAQAADSRPSALMKSADEPLYRAKATGRNRVHVGQAAHARE